MSAECILKIIRQHTGPNASDKVKIKHEEVVAMVRCAREDGHISVKEREVLLSALGMFGGNEIHPDIFSSPQDKAAIADLAMKGIETAERFQRLTPGAQAKFIYRCLVIGSGDTVGFTRAAGHLSDLPADLQKRVAKFFADEKKKAGPQYGDVSWVTATIYNRNSQPYAYIVHGSWQKAETGGYWEAEAYFGPTGERLKASGGYEPPDPPDA